MTDYPTGYGTQLVSLAELRARHTEGDDGCWMEPEYERRLFAWIEAQDGLIGIGDGWRPYGSDTSAASAANKSFHQTQMFGDGTAWFCAVDLVARNPGDVHRSPTWGEVPEQGTPDAAIWGVHANVGGEPWHLQPIELDGYDSWDADGRPRPTPGPDTPVEDDDMTNTPACLWMGGGRLDNFVVGYTGEVFHNWWQPDTGWTPWENLGGQLKSSPAVSGQGDNGVPVRIDVVGQGTDDLLWHRWFEAGTGWAAWTPIATWP